MNEIIQSESQFPRRYECEWNWTDRIEHFPKTISPILNDHKSYKIYTELRRKGRNTTLQPARTQTHKFYRTHKPDLRRNHNNNIPIPRIKTSETSQAKTTAQQPAKQSFSSEAEKTKTSPQIYHTPRSRLTQEFNPPCYERLLTRVRPLMHHKDSSTTPHSHPIKWFLHLIHLYLHTAA